jgi:hypothetical protein
VEGEVVEVVVSVGVAPGSGEVGVNSLRMPTRLRFAVGMSACGVRAAVSRSMVDGGMLGRSRISARRSGNRARTVAAGARGIRTGRSVVS